MNSRHEPPHPATSGVRISNPPAFRRSRARILNRCTSRLRVHLEPVCTLQYSRSGSPAFDALTPTGQHFGGSHALQHAGTPLLDAFEHTVGVPLAPRSGRRPALTSGPGEVSHCGRRQGDGSTSRSCATPSLALPHPVRAGQPRQAFEGNPGEPGATCQGPAASGLHVPLHGIVGLQVSLFLLRTGELRGRAP